jgi:hypothetical protein
MYELSANFYICRNSRGSLYRCKAQTLSSLGLGNMHEKLVELDPLSCVAHSVCATGCRFLFPFSLWILRFVHRHIPCLRPTRKTLGLRLTGHRSGVLTSRFKVAFYYPLFRTANPAMCVSSQFGQRSRTGTQHRWSGSALLPSSGA